MTESEWLDCQDPIALLQFLGERVGERKLRLFSCACCRRHWSLFRDEESRTIVETIERIAEGQASRNERSAAQGAAIRLRTLSAGTGFAGWVAAIDRSIQRVAAAMLSGSRIEIECVTEGLARAAAENLYASNHRDARLGGPSYETAAAVMKAEGLWQADMVRHVAGNPFHPLGNPGSLPRIILRLARSLYRGQLTAFALHDALLDAGHTDLAEHFQNGGEWHPKGCFVLDLILGKS